MSVKIELKNLGILKHAEFSLGDLTVICGENNTGKTYTAYALYGFLLFWHEFIDFPVSDVQIRSLLRDGGIKIGLGGYVERADQKLAEAGKKYTDNLDTIFATDEDRFRDSEFHIQIGTIDILNNKFEHKIGQLLTYSKKKASEELTVTLSARKGQSGEIDPIYLKDVICFIIKNAVFGNSFLSPFISSAERTWSSYFSEGTQFCSKPPT